MEAKWCPIWQATHGVNPGAEPWLALLDALPPFPDPGPLPLERLRAVRFAGSPGAAGGLDGWTPGELRLLPPRRRPGRGGHPGGL